MNWRITAASVIGSSHVANGAQCQDSCWAQVDGFPTGGQLLTMFVADGAGSALKGGEGAELAIQAAADFIDKKLNDGEFGLSDFLSVDLVVAVREKIYAKASTDGLTARDFACTFLGVLSSEAGTLAFQVGDGGIVVDTGEGLELAIVPMSGEYANMTHFVTDGDAVQRLVSKTYVGPALRVAAFSDGLQRLALNLAEGTPHRPFFAKFWHGLETAKPEQDDELHAALVRFLGSQAVNERTDDDKTLVLAMKLA